MPIQVRSQVRELMPVLRPLTSGMCNPCNGLHGEAPPERGTFFRLQVYKRVGKSVIWVFKSFKGLELLIFRIDTSSGCVWLCQVMY